MARGTEVRTGSSGAVRLIRGKLDLPAASMGDERGDAVVASVRTLLSEISDETHLDGAPENLELVKDDQTPVGRFVRFREVRDGIPVFGSEVAAQVVDGSLTRLAIGRFMDREVRARLGDDGDERPMTKRRAFDLATRKLGDEEVLYKASEQVYFPKEEGLRLAWVVELTTAEHDHRFVVDAFTGDLLFQDDRRIHIDGTGAVFAPNPVVTAHDNTFQEGVTPDPTLNAQRVTVTLKEIKKDGTKYRLEGPWVQIKDKVPESITPPELTSPSFDFERGDPEFEAVNIYHHIDSFHRYVRTELGVTNVMNWSIEADHHTSSTGGAYYSPSQKYLGFGGSGPSRPDRGEDGDVMIHEYGHAMQHDMVSNWGLYNTTTQRYETGAMGEGFGDAMTCIFFHEAGGIFQPEVFEDWIFAPMGLRRVDGTKQYPGEGTTGAVGDWVNQVHADGEIWSSALWHAYLAAGGSSSDAATRALARKEFLRTLVLHHFKLNGDATLPEAAEALLETNAEDPEIRGRQILAMLDSFHDRNILRSPAGVDLWLMDKTGHTGSETVTQPFWNSPDVWIRNFDDGGMTHQAPEYGQDNWFYARVRNRGTTTARAFALTFEVKLWQGTQFTYANDFLPPIATAVGFDLAPGASQVVKARWPASLVPAAGSHGCLLVSAYCPTDEAIAGKHVWEDNNLAQKNLTVVDLAPNDTVEVPFQIGNLFNIAPEAYRIEVMRPLGAEELRLSILHPDRRLVSNLVHSIHRVERPQVAQPAPGGFMTPGEGAMAMTPAMTMLQPTRVRLSTSMVGAGGFGADLSDEPAPAVELRLATGSEIVVDGSRTSRRPAMEDGTFLDSQVDLEEGGDTVMSAIHFRPGPLVGFATMLPPRFSPKLRLRVTAPPNAQPGETYSIHLMQRDRRGRVIGGIEVQLNIV